jgi:hypothetical protein
MVSETKAKWIRRRSTSGSIQQNCAEGLVLTVWEEWLEGENGFLLSRRKRAHLLAESTFLKS